MNKSQMLHLGWLSLLLLTLGVAACRPASPSADNLETPPTSQTPAPVTVAVHDSSLIRQGIQITDTAFKKLSGELKMALADGGVPAALPYCNLMAYPLTDSVAAQYQVRLRRTALRYRNPANKPSEAEATQLESFASRLDSDQPISPTLSRQKGKAPIFYRPILLKEGCLACHGMPGDDISTADQARIRELYPDDQATGFKVGDLRGMWVVEFAEK